MKDQFRLNPHDLEHLLVTIETSLAVVKRSQFYLWAQGALQGFIPHETLFCAYGDIAQMRYKAETFSRGLLNTPAEQEVADPVKGLLPRIMDDWLCAGRVPRLLCPDGEDQVGRRQLLADLKRSEFGNVLAHGPNEVLGEGGSFFAFVRHPGPQAERDTYLLGLLMPYLHMALHRMLIHESSETLHDPETVTLLTKREMQVLHWVKNGKTNVEIAQILGISTPTAKNHMQNIMRKFNVTNRAQAVAKGATLRLLVLREPN